VAETKRLKALEDAQRRVRQVVAGLSVDNQLLRDVVAGSYCQRCLPLPHHQPRRRILSSGYYIGSDRSRLERASWMS
jgi:hypothetical protein